MHITPVIFFQGNCREAFAFYQGIFGGTAILTTYSEVMGESTPEGWSDKIISATLESSEFYIKGLDSQIANAEARKIELEVAGNDEVKLREIFEKLCDGGKAKHPIELRPNGELQGRLFDKYGLDWIVTIQK